MCRDPKAGAADLQARDDVILGSATGLRPDREEQAPQGT